MRLLLGSMIAASLLALPLVAKAEPDAFPPRDECRNDAILSAFRTHLGGAVYRKDAALLKALVADDVQNGFGGDDGKSAFIRQWALNGKAISPVWAELRRIIALGCATRRQGEVVVPYAAERLPGDESAFYYVPNRIGTALRAAPRMNAPIIKTLGWDLLIDRDIEAVPTGWANVETTKGQKGYIRTDDIVSNSSQRLYLGKRTGKWKITGFLSGD